MRVRISIGRRGVTASVIMAFCLLSHAAVADPAALVTAFDHQARQMLKNAELSPADRQQRFHALVDEDFDFPTIVRYVLGRNWQTTPDDVRQEFARVFEDYVIEGNADRINAYNGPIAAATTVRTEGENITIVATSFSHDDGDPPTLIEWRVITTPNGLKITDIIVSGVSMALSYREQIATAIQRSGGQVAALIPALRGKLAVTSADAAPAK
ncbi:MAG TPA: ABC transporter substrate-binding protein [Stellaceae bacterium]|nr:ABC transporter substrate-binding protein [Stellaceae bacterium]